jgi:hypothetical protein
LSYGVEMFNQDSKCLFSPRGGERFFLREQSPIVCEPYLLADEFWKRQPNVFKGGLVQEGAPIRGLSYIENLAWSRGPYNSLI